LFLILSFVIISVYRDNLAVITVADFFTIILICHADKALYHDL